MTSPVGNYSGYQQAGYQPQMARGQLRQVPGGQVAVTVATKQIAPVVVAPAPQVANSTRLTSNGHQVVGTRERGNPGIVVIEKTFPGTAPAPVIIVPASQVANSARLTSNGHQLVGTRERGNPGIVVIEKTLPGTAPAPVVGTVGKSAVTGQTVFRPK